ncbi:uncharacterized protein JCM10292_006565 [Rhodotorula paludigena]|uniref:uncharacterized protein n=1 Tax=Rhodotorula paludigena TaxID=86838 RepID=UPI00317E8036
MGDASPQASTSREPPAASDAAAPSPTSPPQPARSTRKGSTSNAQAVEQLRASGPAGGAEAGAYSRVFPFTRNTSQPGGNPPAPGAAAAFQEGAPGATSPRPSLAGISRPSFIALPPRTVQPGLQSPAGVTSPSGRHSVSSAESTGSRIAPDLGGSNARYFPMRSVMYPSSSSAGKRARSSGAGSSSAGAGRSTAPPGSAEQVLSEEGFPSDEGGRSPRSAMSPGELRQAASDLGLLSSEAAGRGARSAGGRSDSRSRGSYERPPGARRFSSRTEGDGSTERAGSSPSSSEQKPPSLDPFLPEPTTHAKIDDPSSDEGEMDDDGLHEREGESEVEERDFGDEEAPKSPPEPPQADPASLRPPAPPAPPGQPSQREARRSAGPSSSRTGISEMPMLMTSRFEHKVDEAGGVYVLTGREGHLERCEDEPIHAPGAVQGFGVLIAFDFEEDERMVVQQVSENSGFIIGLPPRMLFKAKCLSHLLSEDESDALRDAIDALDERDEDESNEEVGPYTFSLSGRGVPGTSSDDAQSRKRLEWTCHAAIHRPDRARQPKRVILELELMDDQFNPLTTVSSEPISSDERGGMGNPEDYGENGINPTEADLIESTVSIAKPLRMLARHKTTRTRRRNPQRRSLEEMDVVGLLSQINDQLAKTDDLETFLKITAGVFKELTEFDRVMIYQFDEAWNGRVVAEQVDWSRTKDLFRGLNFPASDIPAQARDLYRINKVRVLYDRDQPTARLCCRTMDEVDVPLNMTHCHLRAMSPIHIKYLGNMGVRSSMSISIMAFGDLWGLIALHTYGRFGHRVSFSVRQLCKLLGQSISRNIERISFASRLQSRKLINTAASDANPSGYIVAKAEDLLDLFHADFGMLSIGDEAKILGNVSNSQELLAVLEYFRIQRFTGLRSTTDIASEFPDIDYPNGFSLIAGLLYVPLSSEGKDFIFFCRSPQLHEVHWAGNPYANKTQGEDFRPLEPRKSFKIWSETVVGKSRAWTDEEKETASVLCLVYGKFIAVWREKESALAASQLTNLLLANASHEVRTPLNAIINYLELALDGPIQGEVRDNLVRSHAASKSLIHVINDLLDLTRTEKGNELFLTDPFNIADTLNEALALHRDEAERRGLALEIVETPTGTPPTVLGDRGKIRQIITNVVANALKHTEEGGVLIEWGEVVDQDVEDALREKQDSIRIGISVTDTGHGIPENKLEAIFRQFEQVSTIGDKEREDPKHSTEQAVGLGLAVVARIVRNLDGQLQVESKVGKGSKFTFIFPFRLPAVDDEDRPSSPYRLTAPGSPEQHSDGGQVEHQTTRQISPRAVRDPLVRRGSKKSASSAGSRMSRSSGPSDIDSLINAMSGSSLSPGTNSRRQQPVPEKAGSAGSRSTNSASARSTRSFRTAFSNAQSVSDSSSRSGAPLASSSTLNPGSMNITDAKVPLRAARVQASAGSGDAATSPLSSPNHGKYPSGINPYFASARWPVAVPTSASNGHPAQALVRTDSQISSASGASGATEQSSRHTAIENTPRPASPAPNSQPAPRARRESQVSQPADSGDKPKHISQYRKSSVDEAGESIAPMRVLVVEDEMVNRQIISMRLKKDGHDVVVAEHGGVAVRKFEEDRTGFDIVLMDLQMPIMGGVEASRNIRRLERDEPVPVDKQRETSRLNRGIPILAVSASLPERDRPTIVDAELDGWLLKPIDFKRLRTLMRGALDLEARDVEVYRPGQWERGGWLSASPTSSGPASPKPADQAGPPRRSRSGRSDRGSHEA